MYEQIIVVIYLVMEMSVFKQEEEVTEMRKSILVEQKIGRTKHCIFVLYKDNKNNRISAMLDSKLPTWILQYGLSGVFPLRC